MGEKIKVALSFCLVLIVCPYLITVIIQGTTIQGKDANNRNEVLFTSSDEYVLDTEDEQSLGLTEEEQMLSILAKEIPIDYEREAIKAQSVIVRSDYYFKKASGEEEEQGLTLTEMTELFGKKDFLEKYEILLECFEETEGELAYYNGSIVSLPFYSVSAGYTRNGSDLVENSRYPFAVSVKSAMDMSSENYLKVIYIEKTEFCSQLMQLAPNERLEEENMLNQITAMERDEAGYVKQLQVGDTIVTGEQFREKYGLNSTCFQVEEVEGKIRIVTKGLGHGYGLSLYGANELAKNKKTYKEILKYYFPSIEIRE